MFINMGSVNLGPVSATGDHQAIAQGVDFVLYLAALLLILALGPWRGQWRFLFGGLTGIAPGSHLLIELDLVSRPPLVLSLGVAGLCVAAGTYISLWLTSRVGESPAASPDGGDTPC